MALQKKTIRLLILEDSQNEAERLVSLFRNAGQATRVHRLTSSDDLAEALKQIWDLLISAPQSENLDPSEAISAIRRQAKDIPIIQLTATGDSISGSRKGIAPTPMRKNDPPVTEERNSLWRNRLGSSRGYFVLRACSR